MLHHILESQLRLLNVSATDAPGFTPEQWISFLRVVNESLLHKADQKTQQSESDRLQAVIDAFPGFVSWLSNDLVYQGVNARLAEEFSLTPQDFVGKEFSFLNGPSDDPLKMRLQKFFSDSALSASFEVKVRLPKSGPGELLFMLHKFAQQTQAVILGLDVTESRIAQRLVQEQQLKMLSTSKMSSLGEMAGSIALEINNPLTVILSYSESLRKKAEKNTLTSDNAIDLTENIESYVHKIAKIVRGLRTVARDGEHDEFEHTSLYRMLDETLSLCQEKMAASDIKLNLSEVSKDLLIYCQPTQISRAILNLVTNAIEASENSLDKWIKISFSEDEQRVYISFEDSGSGIVDGECEKIFDPFYTTKPANKGTGLGLTISRSIIESHRGTLTFTTRDGNTCFIIKLLKHLV